MCFLVYSKFCITFAGQNYEKMIKETKIGAKIFIEQTTYYVYASESHRQNDAPSLTTSNKKVFNSAKKKEKEYIEKMSDREKLYLDVYDKVYSYKTKYRQGFIASEEAELLKQFPDIDMEKYNDAMMGNTCMVIDGQTIIYHCDIEKALLCGIEKRGLYPHEWD